MARPTLSRSSRSASLCWLAALAALSALAALIFPSHPISFALCVCFIHVIQPPHVSDFNIRSTSRRTAERETMEEVGIDLNRVADHVWCVRNASIARFLASYEAALCVTMHVYCLRPRFSAPGALAVQLEPTEVAAVGWAPLSVLVRRDAWHYFDWPYAASSYVPAPLVALAGSASSATGGWLLSLGASMRMPGIELQRFGLRDVQHSDGGAADANAPPTANAPATAAAAAGAAAINTDRCRTDAGDAAGPAASTADAPFPPFLLWGMTLRVLVALTMDAGIAFDYGRVDHRLASPLQNAVLNAVRWVYRRRTGDREVPFSLVMQRTWAVCSLLQLGAGVAAAAVSIGASRSRL